MSAFTFDADATFVERHATLIAVVLIVLLLAGALTSAEHSVLATVSHALSGVAR